jgi:hypothetical protein
MNGVMIANPIPRATIAARTMMISVDFRIGRALKAGRGFLAKAVSVDLNEVDTER